MPEIHKYPTLAQTLVRGNSANNTEIIDVAEPTTTDSATTKNYVDTAVATKEGTITTGTTAQYFRGDKTFVTLNTTIVPEGTNLYYTDVRADARITAQKGAANGLAPLDASSKIDASYLPSIAVLSVNGLTGAVTLTTTNIVEGTNLYYTATRFNTAFSGKSTSDLTEGSNLYYTNARGIASTLTGYTSGAGTVASTDTILQAIQKLNGNDGLKANIASPTFTGTVTTDRVDINTLHAVTSAGIILESNNGTDVALLGAGGGAGATFYGGVVINGTVSASNLSGTNTGDQTNITGNAGTVTTNANLTGPITSVGNTTSVASQTGTGSTFAMSASPAFTGVIMNTGTSSTTLGDVTGALRTGSVMIRSPYLADGFSPALYFSSTDDNASVPKAAIFCKTTGGGSYLYMGTSNSYVSGVTTSIAIDPNGGIYVGDISALAGSFSGKVALTGNPSFVSASGNAYVYHSTSLGLVMYGSGTSDDFTLAGPTGSNILSIATGTTTARFYGAVNIGGTFTRRSQSGVLSQFQIEGTDFDTSSMSLFANNTGATVCPALFLSRSRGATVGSNTIVQSGDRLGIVLFEGTDGVKPVPGVILQAVVDGTPGVDDMPTRYEVMTCPDGSSSPTVKTVTGSNGSFTVGPNEGNGTGALYTGAGGNIDWGTFTPTRSAESNLDSNVTILSAQYMRVGNTVTVSGLFVADPTSTATVTSFEMSLPIASNLGANEDLTGVAKMVSIANEGMAIFGNITNNTAIVYWISGNTSSQTSTFTYTYRII